MFTWWSIWSSANKFGESICLESAMVLLEFKPPSDALKSPISDPDNSSELFCEWICVLIIEEVPVLDFKVAKCWTAVSGVLITALFKGFRPLFLATEPSLLYFGAWNKILNRLELVL